MKELSPLSHIPYLFLLHFLCNFDGQPSFPQHCYHISVSIAMDRFNNQLLNPQYLCHLNVTHTTRSPTVYYPIQLQFTIFWGVTIVIDNLMLQLLTTKVQYLYDRSQFLLESLGQWLSITIVIAFHCNSCPNVVV